MLSSYRFQLNSHQRRKKTCNDLKRSQMTSNEPNPIADSVSETVAPVTPVKIENKKEVAGNIEIDDEHLP